MLCFARVVDHARDEDAGPTVPDSPLAIAHRLDTEPDVPATGEMRPSHSGGIARVSHGTVATAHDALRSDEIRRSRTLGMFALMLCVVGAIALPFFGGDPRAQAVAFCGIGIMFATNVALLFIAQPKRYTEWRVGIIWFLATIGLLGVVYYFGAFSGVLALLSLGIYFISQGHTWPIAALVYGTAAVGHLIIGLLISFKITPDLGVLRAHDLPMSIMLLAVALLQGVFAVIFVLARVSRRTMLKSVEELQVAVRDIAQREALLEEAKADFARALRIGDAGRFTGIRLGSFELGLVIGRGAMGEVYQGKHVDTGQPAAVKVLLSGAAILPGSLTRFLRESRIASALESPHVVKVLEIGGEEADIPYLAMELLRGTDLATLLRQRRRLLPEEVVELIHQVGAGLTAAASAGIIHRDIKPQNLFLVEDAVIWKILDFGVSTIEGHGGTLTQGQVVGTPAYMAPEQASGTPVDPRADIYSLGAIAYRCLTGRPPFSGRDVAPILYKVVNEMPQAPTSVAQLDPDMDLALAVALAKDPDLRFQTANELADALEAAARGRLSPDIVGRAKRILTVHPWRGVVGGRAPGPIM